MMSLGFVELVVLLLGLGVSLIIPTVALVMAVLIYRKLTRIEELLRERE